MLFELSEKDKWNARLKDFDILCQDIYFIDTDMTYFHNDEN